MIIYFYRLILYRDLLLENMHFLKEAYDMKDCEVNLKTRIILIIAVIAAMILSGCSNVPAGNNSNGSEKVETAVPTVEAGEEKQSEQIDDAPQTAENITAEEHTVENNEMVQAAEAVTPPSDSGVEFITPESAESESDKASIVEVITPVTPSVPEELPVELVEPVSTVETISKPDTQDIETATPEPEPAFTIPEPAVSDEASPLVEAIIP